MDQRNDSTNMNSGNGPQITPSEQPAAKKWTTILLSNWRLKGALILMLIVAGMYGWKNLAVKRMEKATKQQAVQLTAATDQRILEKNMALLRMTSIPLSWVVRMEMPKGNYDNIDQYFKQIIKEDHFKVILLAGIDGKIIVSTDRRMEGADLSEYYPASLLDQYETSVSPLGEQELIVATPVIGLTAKLGVLVMVYPMQEPGRQKPKV